MHNPSSGMIFFRKSRARGLKRVSPARSPKCFNIASSLMTALATSASFRNLPRRTMQTLPHLSAVGVCVRWNFGNRRAK